MEKVFYGMFSYPLQLGMLASTPLLVAKDIIILSLNMIGPFPLSSAVVQFTLSMPYITFETMHEMIRRF